MAKHLSDMPDRKNEIMLWCRKTDQARRITETRENTDYLRGVKFADNVIATSDLDAALRFSKLVIIAVPTQSIRALLALISDKTNKGGGFDLVSLAKGIEIQTGLFVHQIAAELLPLANYTVFSGPSHAEEVGAGLPTALVSASSSDEVAVRWQNIINNERLRVYTSKDVLGVEIGGAMKNIIAIAVGVARAVGFGDNSAAALATRGLAEITAFGIQMGATPATFAGLAGVGDLMATCFSLHSRNLRFGMAIGKGDNAEEAASAIGQVVEGMYTTRALVTRGRSEGIELPLSEGVYKVLYEGVPYKEVLAGLLFRKPKPEMADL
jgi:glycerol-3-phosphate dehydrogenase (NAD(P)+)